MLAGMGSAGQVGGFQVSGFDHRAGHPDRTEVRVVNVMEAGQVLGILFRFDTVPTRLNHQPGLLQGREHVLLRPGRNPVGNLLFNRIDPLIASVVAVNLVALFVKGEVAQASGFTQPPEDRIANQIQGDELAVPSAVMPMNGVQQIVADRLSTLARCLGLSVPAQLGQGLEGDLFQGDLIAVALPGFRQTAQGHVEGVEAVQPGEHIEKRHRNSERSAVRLARGVGQAGRPLHGIIIGRPPVVPAVELNFNHGWAAVLDQMSVVEPRGHAWRPIADEHMSFSNEVKYETPAGLLAKVDGNRLHPAMQHLPGDADPGPIQRAALPVGQAAAVVRAHNGLDQNDPHPEAHQFEQHLVRGNKQPDGHNRNLFAINAVA